METFSSIFVYNHVPHYSRFRNRKVQLQSNGNQLGSINALFVKELL
jgi:hypothetical protein